MKNCIYRKFLLSYLIILSVSCLSLTLIFISANGIIQKITLFGHKSSVNQIVNKSNSYLIELKKNMFFVESFWEKFVLLNNPDNPKTRENLQAIINLSETTLGSYCDIFAVYKDNVISSDIALDVQEMVKFKFGKNSSYLFETDLIPFQENYKIHQIIYCRKFGEKEKAIAFTDSNRNGLKLIYVLKLDFFDNLIKNDSWLEIGDIVITDSNQNIIYEHSGREIKKKKCVKLCDYLELHDITITTKHNNDFFQREKNIIKSIVFLFFGIMISLGIILSLFFSQKQSSPINKLAEITNINNSPTKIDLISIQNSVLQLISDRNLLTEKLSIKDIQMKQILLGRILEFANQKDEVIIREQLFNLGIDYYKRSMCIISLKSNDPISICDFSEKAKTCCDQFFENSHIAITSSGLSVLVSCNEMSSNIQEEMKAFRTLFELNFNISILSGISSLFSDYSLLTEKYIESIFSMEQENNKVSIDIFGRKKTNNNLSLVFYDQFINSIESNNYQLAYNFCEAYIEKIVYSCNSDYILMKARLISLIVLLIDVCLEIERNKNVNLTEMIKKLEYCFVCDNFVSIKDKILIALNKFKDNEIKCQEKTEKQQLVDDIKKEVAEELTNPQMSVSYIADAFSLSSSNISQKFKKETGICLSDYINMNRIKLAKELLALSDETIKEIALKTGFWSDDSFIKCFKKFEGITPGNFRKR